MLRTLRLLGWVVVLLVGGAACSGTSSSGTSVGKIASVTFRQVKAVPNFDSSPHTVTDPARTGALRSVLRNDGWKPGSTTNETGPRGCTGGTGTEVQITFVDGKKSTIAVYDCGAHNDSLTTDLTSLVDSWR